VAKLISNALLDSGISGIAAGLAMADTDEARAYLVAVQEQLLACRAALSGVIHLAECHVADWDGVSRAAGCPELDAARACMP